MRKTLNRCLIDRGLEFYRRVENVERETFYDTNIAMDILSDLENLYTLYRICINILLTASLCRGVCHA